MDCDRCLELMSQALDGPLDPARQEELAAHLNLCPRCAALYRQMQEQSAALRSLDPPFPEGLHQRILDHLPPQERPQQKSKLVYLRRWGALAACLAVVAALGISAPWEHLGGNNSAAPAAMGGEESALYSSQEPGGPRSQESPLPVTGILSFQVLPQGWEALFPDVRSLDGMCVSQRDALAFLALLEEQGIPYTLDGTLDGEGLCQLNLTEEMDTAG